MFVLLLFLYVNICINVYLPQLPTYMRSNPLVRRLEIEITSILPITILCVCLFVHLLSHIDLNCRFISFNTQLNTLTVSTKKWKPNNVNFYLLLLSYVLIFESYFVIFLSFDFFKVYLDIQRVTKKLVIVSWQNCTCYFVWVRPPWLYNHIMHVSFPFRNLRNLDLCNAFIIVP